jgi:hypothetical protein
MGFWSWLKGKFGGGGQIALSSRMPQVAIDEIVGGRLPQLITTRVMLKQGEILHYFDPAVLLIRKKRRKYVRRGGGTSFKGFFGMRHYMGGGNTDVVENEYDEQAQGTLYITNKRVIFQSSVSGFDNPHTKLSAVNPYSDGIELQYGNKIYRLFVPSGGMIQRVLNLII